MTTLPDWYWENPQPVTRRRSRTAGAVRRGLAGLAEAMAREISSGNARTSRHSRIEPRVKVVGMLALIFGTTFLHGLIPLTAILVVAMALVIMGGIRPRRLLTVWMGVPLFSLAIIIPAATNLVTDGPAIFTVCGTGPIEHLPIMPMPHSLTITHPGLIVATRFLLRSLGCVTLGFVLVATTDRAALVNGFVRLGMPRVFGAVLAMAQSYLGVILRTAEQIHLAKLSRTIGGGSVRGEQKWVAAGIASLFRKTHRLADEVHTAMIARGYDGTVRVRKPQPVRVSDGVWLVGMAMCLAAVVAADRLLWGLPK